MHLAVAIAHAVHGAAHVMHATEAHLILHECVIRRQVVIAGVASVGSDRVHVAHIVAHGVVAHLSGHVHGVEADLAEAAHSAHAVAAQAAEAAILVAVAVVLLLLLLTGKVVLLAEGVANVQFALLENELLFFDAKYFGGVVLAVVRDEAVAFRVTARVCDDARVFYVAKVTEILAQLFLGRL